MWATAEYLIYLRGPWQWYQNLVLVRKLAIWSPFLMVDILLCLDAGGRVGVLPQLYVLGLDDSLPFLRSE